MRVLYDRVAAVDVRKDMVKVAIRVPGGKRGTRTTGVPEFRTFTGCSRRWLASCGGAASRTW